METLRDVFRRRCYFRIKHTFWGTGWVGVVSQWSISPIGLGKYVTLTIIRSSFLNPLSAGKWRRQSCIRAPKPSFSQFIPLKLVS